MPQPETLLSLIRASGHEPPPIPRRRATAPSAFEGAASGRRLGNWRPVEQDINTLIWSNGDILRARARDAVRRNPWAAKAVDSWVANLISTGHKPQWVDSQINALMQPAFLRWTDEADAYGVTDFYGLQSLVCRSMIEGGECFVRLRPRRASDGLFIPLQLQALEAEHCPLNLNETLSNGNVIRYGIEFDHLGRRVAYWMYPNHPNSVGFAADNEPKRIPASQIIHVFRPLQPGQLRGIPWLAPVLVKLYELDKYDDAELVRKQLAAMFAGFVTEAGAGEPPIPGTTASTDDGVELGTLEPGTLQKLLPGEDIKFSSPAEVGGQYETFMRIQLRSIAGGMSGLTYEQLTGDLTSVNYSSIRAGLLEFRRAAEQIQHQILIYQFCRPVVDRVVEAAILFGSVVANGYASDPYRYKNIRWIAPGWPWVDPLKDITAKIQEIQAGLTSRSIAVAATGEDIELIDRDQAADNDRADALGLKYTSDGRNANPNTDNVKDTEAGASERPEDNESPMKEPKTGAQSLARPERI